LVFGGHGDELFLFEEFGEFLSSVEKMLCGGIKIRSKLSKSGYFSVLS
jgi:hypothetical protein